MKILIDADACPVRHIAVEIAKEYSIDVVIVSNINHMIDDEYAEIVTVDSGNDVADHEIIRRLDKGDIVITQDYGLASLVLLKRAFAIHHDGWFYTNDNIDTLLMQRQMSQKMRQARKRNSHIPKRTENDNIKFRQVFNNFIKEKRE